MNNSTIKIKPCKCGCGKPKSFGYNGYYYAHANEEVKERVEEKRKSAKQRSIEKQQRMSKIRSIKPLQDNDAVIRQIKMNKWFEEKAKEMTGICSNCGGKTCKGDKKYERFSICHILEKKNFRSVETHPLNWVELCHFGNSCHANFDHAMIELQDMKCWNLIQFNFALMYPSIDKSEYQFIPQVLLDSL